MHLWTKVQHDPILQKINQDLRQKEEAFEQVNATLTTLVPTQCLAQLKTSNDLQDKIEKLLHKQHIMAKHLKPWTATTLQLSHDIDGATKQLNQILESVTAATEGPTSQKLVDLAQSAAVQSQEVLPPLITTLTTLHAQVETAPPQ